MGALELIASLIEDKNHDEDHKEFKSPENKNVFSSCLHKNECNKQHHVSLINYNAALRLTVHAVKA